MIVVYLILALVLVSFGFVLLFGAPYLPTMSKQVTIAMDLAAVGKGTRLLELGCGDGKVLLAAAARGAVVTGYELNPILWCIAWLRTRKYGKQVRVVLGDFWRVQWPATDVIFVFLLPKYMPKLDTKIAQQPARPVKLVSFAFTIPDHQPTAEQEGVRLYEYR